MTEFSPKSSSHVETDDSIPVSEEAMKQLGTFCEFKYGRSLPGKARQGGSFPVYGSNGIVGWHHEPITNGPTIIIGRKGSAGALRYSGTSCCPIDTTYYVDRSCTAVNLRWLYFMLQMVGLDNLSKHAAVPGLNRNDAYEKELLVPLIDEQKKIAAVLDKADVLRRQRQESLQLTEELLQSLFLEMFGDPVMNPKGLPMRALGEFGIVQTGNTPPRSNKFNYAATGLEWIKTDNIIEDQIYVTKAVEQLSETGAKVARFAPAGSLLVACIAGSEKSIGRAALTNRPVAFNQQINSIIPHAGVSPLFLYFLLKVGRRYVQLAAGKGMKKIVNKSTFENIRFISPSEDDQLRFEIIAGKLISHSQRCWDQSFQLESLFLSIQQYAFRGELDLSRITLVDEVESPANASLPEPPTTEGRFSRPGSFIAPPEIEAQMLAFEDELEYGTGDSIPWSEDFFKYRILSQALTPPFSFNEIWEAVSYDMNDAKYEDVKAKVFEYIEVGILEQQFDMERKEIVFYPRP
jgi:type I restriction enzyme S subunit